MVIRFIKCNIYCSHNFHFHGKKKGKDDAENAPHSVQETSVGFMDKSPKRNKPKDSGNHIKIDLFVV